MTEIKLKLKKKEIEHLKEFTKKGQRSARELTRANILLLVNKGMKTKTIAETLGVHRTTIHSIKKRYEKEGLENALKDKPRSGQPKKYTDKHEAEIIATACANPPKGRKSWTMELLAQELRQKKGFRTISRESVRLVLKKQRQSRG